MPPSYFPLRWESTGDQWWYASPIDWAAANGHYDLVRELLHIDPNLLIKLTSLRRIRRLEIVWDDDSRFADVARCRSSVARSLLLECEISNGNNTLIRAGYGGWLLYTAASAGDMGFVQELLQRDPLMVFGEGEFGVTDILYAAARSKNPEVFRVLLDFSMSPRCLTDHLREGKFAESSGYDSVFRWEMMTRAVHAAARGGNWEILRELLSDCGNILAYRDVQGSTVLHTASGRGQVEVVKNLVASFNIIDSKDNGGNTSLHIAAFRGHLAVLEALVVASPSSISLTNNMGDTFLHIAVAGFRNPAFRRLDRQMELMKQLVLGTVVNIEEIINYRNNDGRTVLHMAVGNVQGDLVSLLMTIRSINLNVRDINGMTPLDLLNQHPRSASSEVMIKQLISAGGMSSSRDYMKRSVIGSHLKMKAIGCSPGTSFKISDAEIFLYTGIEASDACGDRGTGRPSSCSSISQTDLIPIVPTEGNHTSGEKKRHSSVSNAASRLKTLLRWPRKKDKKINSPLKTSGDEASVGSFKKCSEREDTPTPLRQRFSKTTSLQNNKRTLAVRTSTPSPSTKKKLSAGLMHGVIEAMPHLAPPRKSPSSSSRASAPSPLQNDISSEIETVDPSVLNSPVNNVSTGNVAPQKPGSVHTKLRRHYFCFGAQGLALEDSANGKQSKRFFKRGMLSVS